MQSNQGYEDWLNDIEFTAPSHSIFKNQINIFGDLVASVAFLECVSIGIISPLLLAWL